MLVTFWVTKIQAYFPHYVIIYVVCEPTFLIHDGTTVLKLNMSKILKRMQCFMKGLDTKGYMFRSCSVTSKNIRPMVLETLI